MSITDYLEGILTARYGRDVRQDIHDAIEACYKDGKVGATDVSARTALDALEARVSAIESAVSAGLENGVLTLAPDFTVYATQTPVCVKLGGVVMVWGSVRANADLTFTSGSEVLVAEVPAGFRPYGDIAIAQKYNGVGDNSYFLDYRANGEVYVKYPDVSPVPKSKIYNLDIVYIAEDAATASQQTLDEIADARIGHDAVIYPSLGDAIRGQISAIRTDLQDALDAADAASESAVEAAEQASAAAESASQASEAAGQAMSATPEGYADFVETAKRLGGIISITTATDINSLTRAGEFYVSGGNMSRITNLPTTSPCRIIVESSHGPGSRTQNRYCRQIVRPYNTAIVFTRTSTDYGDNWSEWEQFIPNGLVPGTFTPVSNSFASDTGYSGVYYQGRIGIVKIDMSLTGTATGGWQTVATLDRSSAYTLPANVMANNGAFCRARVNGKNLQISYSGAASSIGTTLVYVTT